MSTTFAENDAPTGEIQAVVDQAAPSVVQPDAAQPDPARGDDGSSKLSNRTGGARTAKADARTAMTDVHTVRPDNRANTRTARTDSRATAANARRGETAETDKRRAQTTAATEASSAGLSVTSNTATSATGDGITAATSAANTVGVPAGGAADVTHVAAPVDTPPDEQRIAPARPRRRIAADLLTYLAYALVALWITSKLWPIGGAHPMSAVDANDQAFFEWMLSHGARVVTHFDSPLYTDRLNVPTGVNLMANTSILALSIPLAPITIWLGPAVSYALLITLGLAGTAAAWYYVLSRHLVSSRSAAIIGGAIAGLGPGIVSHANGHPNIVAQFLVPFIVWRAVKLREPGHALRNGIALGLLVAVQVFINEEMLFIVALAVGITLVAYAGMRWHDAKPQIRPFLAGAGITAITAGVIIAYPLWRQFFGPGAYRGLNPAVQGFGADLAAFPAFATRTLLGDFTNNAHLASGPAEQNSFFGWPLLITFVVALFWLRRNVFARALGIAALVLSVFSLGSKIVVDGRSTHIPAPWTLVKKLPIFDSVVPTRLSLFVLPIIAVVIAMAHDRVLSIKTIPGYASETRAPQSRLAWCFLLGLSLIAIIPTRVPAVPSVPTPAFISQGTWKSYVAPDETVVPVPLPEAGAVASMFWAADTDLGLRLPAGYFLGPDPRDHNVAIFGAPQRHTTALIDKVIATNKQARIRPADRKAAIADLRYWRAAVIIQLPSSPSARSVRQTISDLLNLSPKFSGGVWVWDVRQLVSQQPTLSG